MEREYLTHVSCALDGLECKENNKLPRCLCDPCFPIGI